jgi:putative DNA primase/helicase
MTPEEETALALARASVSTCLNDSVLSDKPQKRDTAPPAGGMPLNFDPPRETAKKATPKESPRSVSASSPVPFTEDALACQFVARHGDRLRYVSRWGKWMQYTGTVWQEEDTLLPFDLARQICRDNCELPTVTEAIKKNLSAASTVAAIVKMASADRQHAAKADQWDRNPMALNTPAGTVDLTAGTMQAHQALDYHSKITAVGPSSKAPDLWLQFLDRIFEDKYIIPYLQRVCGYFLTGSTREHAMFFCWGSGKNGKSTFTRTLVGILNGYAREASVETFTETKSDQHPTGLAGLQGSRLALVRETEKNSYWQEAKLKECTGGDRVTARYMRQDFFDFQPEFKLLVNGNNKPRLRSVDEAIRRRMNLIPFSVTIPEHERDPHLYDKLTATWPQILGWMVEGCLDWQQNGLCPPESVTGATNEYLSDEDKVGLWLEERCILGPQETASSTACYLDWVAWHEQIGEHAGSQRAFSQDLAAREGIRNERTRTGRMFIGLSLKSDHPQP